MKTEALNNHSYESVVDKVEDGPHGLFAFAKRISDNLVITFSCKPPTWTEPHLPRPGDVVVCSDVHKRRSGWCAEKAEAKRPPPVVEDVVKSESEEKTGEEIEKVLKT